MDPNLRSIAGDVKGFMPEDEGLALYEAALDAPPLPWVEIGSYCGKSSVYLGAAAREVGTFLVTIDHHGGSEEHQPGEEYHDAALTGSSGAVDTLPALAETLVATSLSDVVLAVAGRSETLARTVTRELGLVFIDGGHSSAAANADYEGWSPKLARGGLLMIHDVFPDPHEGGRPPFEIYERALASGHFVEARATGSLRVLLRA